MKEFCLERVIFKFSEAQQNFNLELDISYSLLYSGSERNQNIYCKIFEAFMVNASKSSQVMSHVSREQISVLASIIRDWCDECNSCSLYICTLLAYRAQSPCLRVDQQQNYR